MYGIEQYTPQKTVTQQIENEIRETVVKASTLQKLTSRETAILALAFIRKDLGLEIPQHIVCYHLTKMQGF